MSSHNCPRCGAPLPPPTGRGRPRIWCSGTCRVLAYQERQAAARGTAAVKTVEVRRESVREVSRPFTTEQALQRVLDDPGALQRVFSAVAWRAARGHLDPQTAEVVRPHTHHLAAHLVGTRLPAAPTGASAGGTKPTPPPCSTPPAPPRRCCADSSTSPGKTPSPTPATTAPPSRSPPWTASSSTAASSPSRPSAAPVSPGRAPSARGVCAFRCRHRTTGIVSM
jgi:hypothetical protein